MILSNLSSLENIPSDKDEFIEKFDDISEKFILIAATEKLARELEKKLLRKLKRPLSKTNIYSFQSFIKNSFQQLSGENILNEQMLCELISIAIERSNTTIYSKDFSYRTINKIVNVISGLRDDGIDSEQMLSDLNAGTTDEYILRDKEKFSDLYKIMFEYESLLAEGFYDMPKAQKELINELKSGIFKDYTFIFDEFNKFRQPDIDLIECLLINNNVVINIKFDTEHGPFLGENNFIIKDLQNLELNLYNKNKSPFSEKAKEISKENDIKKTLKLACNSNSNKIKLFECNNIQEEVFAITKLTKYLITKEGYDPSEICIISRDTSLYSDLFREFFADNGIPSNITDRFDLDRSPVVSSIFIVLDIILNDAKFEDIHKLLFSGYLHTDSKNSQIFIKKGEDYRLLGGIPGKGFDSYIDQLSMKYEKFAESNSDEIDEVEDMLLEIRRLKELFKNYDKSKKYTAKEFRKLLLDIIERFKIQKMILKTDELLTTGTYQQSEEILISEKIEKDSKALSKFIQIINDLVFIISKTNSKNTFSFEYLYKKLQLICSSAKYQIREKHKYGVDITSFEQTRGLDYKVKILTGAVEGLLPIPYKTDDFIGKELTDSEARHYSSEFIQFFEFLSNSISASEQKYIFYYNTNEGEKQVLSHFIVPIIDELEVIEQNNFKEFNWYNSYINTREKLVYGDEEIDNNIKKRTVKFQNSEDLQIIENELNSLVLERKKKRYAVTEIERLDRYEVDYFYERVIRLSKREDIEIFLSGLELGSLIHESIDETFKPLLYKDDHLKEIKSNDDKFPDLKLINLSRSDEGRLNDLFFEIAKNKIETLRHHHKFFDIEIEYLIGTKESKGLIPLWFENTLEDILDSKFVPAGFEYSFRDVTIEYNDKKYNFSGKIDRIDFSEDLNWFNITDYKVNETSGANKNQSIQLPLYGILFKQILKEKHNIDAEPKRLLYNFVNYKDADDKRINKEFGIVDILEKAKPVYLNNKLDDVSKLIEKIENYDYEVSQSNYKNKSDFFKLIRE